MDRTVAKFSSFAEADKATREYYRSLTPQQRIQILLDLIAKWRAQNNVSDERLERVYRITKLSRG